MRFNRNNRVALNVGSVDKTTYKDFSGGIRDDHYVDPESTFFEAALEDISTKHYHYIPVTHHGILSRRRRIGKPKCLTDTIFDECWKFHKRRALSYIDNFVGLKFLLPQDIRHLDYMRENVLQVQLDIRNRILANHTDYSACEFLFVATKKPSEKFEIDRGLRSFLNWCVIEMNAVEQYGDGTMSYISAYTSLWEDIATYVVNIQASPTTNGDISNASVQPYTQNIIPEYSQYSDWVTEYSNSSYYIASGSITTTTSSMPVTTNWWFRSY